MADAERAYGAGATGRRDGQGRPPGPVPRPGSDGEHALQQRMGTTERADRFYGQQVLDHLNDRMREFVQSQEMFFLATADRYGECDNSFRAGPPGFLRVLDEGTLLYPEYRGNGVHASLGNLQENPQVGILLMDFLRARIGLHVNGRAEICEDAAIRAEFPDLPVDPVPGRRAQLWVRVRVQEAYIHCAKHIPHLQKVPRGGGREWGTDDHKRKGGDFFGAARDARERPPVQWQPREHEAPAAPPHTRPPAGPPVVPAPVLGPGQVPGHVPAPPPSAPPEAPAALPGSGRSPEPAPEPAPAAAQHQGPRHARARAAHQTPVAAWRSRRQAAASRPSPHAPTQGPSAAGPHALPPGEVPAQGQVPEPSSSGRRETPRPGGPPQLYGHDTGRAYPREPSPAPGEGYGAPPSGEAAFPATEEAYAPAPGEGYDAYRSAGDRFPPDAGYDESYAAGWHTVGMRGAGPPRGPVPSGPVPPGVGAAVGASAVIAARGAVPEGEDADAWRQEAERALADAQQRAADEEPSSFQGWFG